jgi:hypothetical protein
LISPIWRWQATGRHGPGRKSERRLVTAAQRAGGLWAASFATEKYFFSVSFYRDSIIVFCSVFLSKFVIAFSTQVIPTKICLENAKVTEFFLKSSKL